MRYSSRLFLYTPLLALLVLAIVAGLRWQSVAGGLETWLRQHNGREIAPGVTLEFATESLSGFPFNVDAVIRNVTFRVKSARTSGSWHADAFAIHELTFGREQQIFEAAGSQTVFWRDAGGDTHRLIFVPGSLQASAIQSRGRLVRFDLDINGIGSREISGDRAQLHFRKAPDHDAIDVVASLDELHLAPALQSGFGAVLHHADIRASLEPAAPLARLFDGDENWDTALETWRRKPGQFHLDSAQARWHAIRISAKGAIGLDFERRAQGKIILDIDGDVRAADLSPAGDRLARAIVQLTKANNDTSRTFSLVIQSGEVNVRLTKVQQAVIGSGAIDPFY